MTANHARRFPIRVNFLVEARRWDAAFREALATYARTVMIAPVVLADADTVPEDLEEDVVPAGRAAGEILVTESAETAAVTESTQALIVDIRSSFDSETGGVIYWNDLPVFHAVALEGGNLEATLDHLCRLPDDATRYLLVRTTEEEFAEPLLQDAVRTATETRWEAVKWMGLETMIRVNRIARDGPVAAQRIEQELRDSQVDIYDAHRDERFWSVITRHVRKALALARDDRVVDLGSGVGRQTIPFSEECGRIVALDFSHGSMAELLRRKALPAVQASITDVPLADRSFDKALCCEVLQHLPSDAMRRAGVAEAFRVLRPGGTFVLVVYNWNGFQAKFKYDKEGYFKGALFYHAFERDELRELLDGAGFADVRVRPIGYFWQRFNRAPALFEALDRVLSSVGAFDWLARWYIAVGRRPP